MVPFQQWTSLKKGLCSSTTAAEVGWRGTTSSSVVASSGPGWPGTWKHWFFCEGIHFTVELLDFIVMMVCYLLVIVSQWLKYRVYVVGIEFDSPCPCSPTGTHPSASVVCHRVWETPDRYFFFWIYSDTIDMEYCVSLRCPRWWFDTYVYCKMISTSITSHSCHLFLMLRTFKAVLW